MYDDKWGSYLETVLVFPGEAELAVDLREKIPPATRRAFPAMGLDGPFGVVTAFNPKGEGISPEENARRMKELERELASAGHTFVRVDGCSPDRTHCECGVAVMLDRGSVVDIARRWDQIAIFWWDGSEFWIVGAITPGEERLPSPRK
jgi:hypothetical protein